jgi:hypothetical protein
VWNGVLCLLVAFGIVALARKLGPPATGHLRSIIALTLLVLNIYGVWLMITHRDTALDNAFFVWGLVAVYTLMARPGERRALLVLTACLLVAASGMMRVSSYILWLSLLVWLIAICRQKRLAPLLLVAVLAVLGYSYWNHWQHGAFTLTTTTPRNIYYGNHDSYLDVHPQHDIETIQEVLQHDRAVITARTGVTDRDELDRVLARNTVRQMGAEPGESVLRFAMKGLWYFLAPFKIPLFTETPLPKLRIDGTLLPGERDARISLVHLPYGLTFLVLFWLSLVYYARRMDWMRLAFYIPFIVMGLISILLFPDTRFRQAAELALYAPMAAYVIGIVAKIGPGKDGARGSDAEAHARAPAGSPT